MIKYATENDLDILLKYDKHIDKEELKNIINHNRVIILENENTFIGWLRYGLFWDNIPFMNMLFILEEYRNKGYGKQLISFWENEMLKNGYNFVLTSTQSNEQGQFFYRKNNYKDVGNLILPNEVSEIILYKNLKANEI